MVLPPAHRPVLLSAEACAQSLIFDLDASRPTRAFDDDSDHDDTPSQAEITVDPPSLRLEGPRTVIFGSDEGAGEFLLSDVLATTVATVAIKYDEVR
jgi:hypothetical protein